jgi:hypothetical protein
MKAAQHLLPRQRRTIRRPRAENRDDSLVAYNAIQVPCPAPANDALEIKGLEPAAERRGGWLIHSPGLESNQYFDKSWPAAAPAAALVGGDGRFAVLGRAPAIAQGDRLE